ncbi:MAG: hypothetical protein ACAI35_20100 [Candidatus Methylacidiphilales bacterium]|nr:hypothetical protein [Candidatus Methylacidiphilales bacterium]
MRKALHFLILLVSFSFVVGCASTDQTASSSSPDLDPNGQRVSTTPWGRPEKWESGGQLGTAMGN